MRTIVVGVDGSPSSMRALQFAAGLSRDLDNAGLVAVFARHIYIAMPTHVAEDIYSEVLDADEAKVAADVQAELGDSGLRWSFEAPEGEPAAVLNHIADRTSSSFLVVGRSGRSRIGELLLGSVSNRLAHGADRPLVIVP